MSIVVVAKAPLPGRSKTRLIPLLGEEGSVQVAEAMLSDVLVAISKEFQNCQKVLLYAPSNDEGFQIMHCLLKKLFGTPTADTAWTLLPMISSTLTHNLRSPNLGQKLTDALQRVRELRNQTVVFLGMDSPELPIEEINHALSLKDESAHMCPSVDGGYGMLSVPVSAPETIFDNILWSHPLTAISQVKALTDHGVSVSIGRLMHDIDEPEDVHALCDRLRNISTGKDELILSCLYQSTEGVPNTSSCPHTRAALRELKLL